MCPKLSEVNRHSVESVILILHTIYKGSGSRCKQHRCILLFSPVLREACVLNFFFLLQKGIENCYELNCLCKISQFGE
jgi:hypothetical protein